MIADRPWFFRAVVILSLAAALVYLAELVVTIPALEALSGGQTIFDMRLAGYDLEAAQALVAALGPEGIALYLGRHQMLDSALPMLIAAAVAGWAIILARRLTLAGRSGMMTPASLIAMLALIFATIDYSENGAVRMILMTAPDSLTADLVDRASNMTRLKLLTLFAAFVGLAILVAQWMSVRRQGGR